MSHQTFFARPDAIRIKIAALKTYQSIKTFLLASNLDVSKNQIHKSRNNKCHAYFLQTKYQKSKLTL